MNDEQELETRLRDAFRHGSLPSAPASLYSALEDVPAAPVIRRAGGRADRAGVGRRPWGALAVAAVLVVGGAAAIAFGNRGPNPSPLPSASSPASSLAADPSIGAMTRFSYEPQWTADVPFNLNDLWGTVEIVQQRIDATGLVGVRAAIDDQARIIVDVPAGTDPDPIRRLVGQRGLVAFVPLGTEVVDVGSTLDPETRTPLFDATSLVDASIIEDQLGQPALQLTLTEPAAGVFAQYTAVHLGEMFAIVLDGTVISAPSIQSVIPDGVVQISFGSSVAPDPTELAMLATVTRLGPLPVALVEVESGPAPSSSQPIAADPPIRCGARVEVEGSQLECTPAAHVALAILPADHPAIAEVRFDHGCNDLINGSVIDCATQMSGTVTVSFVDGSQAVLIAVDLDSMPVILPNLPAPGAS